MVKKISTRLSELEANLKGPPRRVCEICGKEGGGQIITERHDLDGNVHYSPHEPCSGCAKLAPPGVIRHILICSPHAHGLECPHCGPPHPAVVERKKHLRDKGIFYGD